MDDTNSEVDKITELVTSADCFFGLIVKFGRQRKNVKVDRQWRIHSIFDYTENGVVKFLVEKSLGRKKCRRCIEWLTNKDGFYDRDTGRMKLTSKTGTFTVYLPLPKPNAQLELAA